MQLPASRKQILAECKATRGGGVAAYTNIVFFAGDWFFCASSPSALLWYLWYFCHFHTHKANRRNRIVKMGLLQYVVKNEAMRKWVRCPKNTSHQSNQLRRDPVEIYGSWYQSLRRREELTCAGWRVFALTCSACFGGMLFGWDIGSIGGVIVMPAFKSAYGIGTFLTDSADLRAPS